MIKQLLVAAALATVATANANWFSGNDLLRYFDGDEFAQGGAAGFVTGVASVINGELACIPSAVTVKQMQDMVLARLRSSPEIRHRDAELIVAAELMFKFPCPDSGPNTKFY